MVTDDFEAELQPDDWDVVMGCSRCRYCRCRQCDVKERVPSVR